MIIALIIAVFVVLVDQVTKYLVVANIDLSERITAIPGILDFVYVQNDGMAWGLGNSAFRWVFVTITIIVSGIMIFFMTKKDFRNPLYFVASGLIIGGGIGNMIDRIINGYVIDFLSLSFFNPVCNLADYAITAGTVILAVYIIFFYGKKNKSEDSKPELISDKNEL